MTVVEVNFGAEWEKPVAVKRDGYGDLVIDGPRQALRYMQHDFPKKNGELYRLALGACYSALRRRDDTERARAYFIAAWGEQQSKSRH